MLDNGPNESSNLAKSRLFIAGLIVVLVYAIAGLATGGKWTDEQRWLLSVFLVAYPFVVLGLAYHLLTKHSDKF